MTQFALYRLRDGGELVCRIQTDLGAETAYVLCAPVVLSEAWGPPVQHLHVPVEHDGRPHLVLMTQMVALPHHVLGAAVGSASARRDALVRAVDLLVTGF